MVRFLTFSSFHNKVPPTGSTNIRVLQLLKYWKEADLYTYGELPDTMIFQKVYVAQDYQFPKHLPCKKILDICDPDWLNGLTPVKETVDAMDAVTVPTEEFARFMRQLTNKPVVVIPDRFDLEVIPPLKEHTRKAKTVVWFGYRHNAITLKPAMNLINSLGLNLLVVADDDPLPWQWLATREGEPFRKIRYTFKKYKEETIYQELQTADFAILPSGNRPVDPFKSNNKTVKAILAGLPVATTSDEVIAYIEAKNRREYLLTKYDIYRDMYDVKKSVEQYQELIASL